MAPTTVQCAHKPECLVSVNIVVSVVFGLPPARLRSVLTNLSL